jgi:sortase (surface protein transpeptidase)
MEKLAAMARVVAFTSLVVGLGVWSPIIGQHGVAANQGPIVPTHMTIPSIGVDAAVEQVGLTADRDIQAPQQWMDAAWFSGGYQPGQRGNAIIAGHLDSTTGPAVFWRLGSIQVGALITVDNGATPLTFVVQQIQRYREGEAPLEQLTGSSNFARLNLITCSGTWDPVAKRYSDRTVVYAVLQGFEGVAPLIASRYFPETGGFTVADDDQAMFLSEFNRLGGVALLGYPVSRRFTFDGFVVQAFQKAILQWHPELQQAEFINVLDWMHLAHKDDWLASVRMTPPPASTVPDNGLSWDLVVARHLAYLDANPTIAATYFAVDQPVLRYGLPVSPVTDEGAALVIRCQRAVLQLWKTDQPWAAAGQVTVANGGDLAKEAGLLPGNAITLLEPAITLPAS